MGTYKPRSHLTPDGRRHNGRPTDDELTIHKRDKDIYPDDEVTARPRVRVWVEGDVVIPEWDDEALDLKDTLPGIFQRLGMVRDQTLSPGLMLRVQVVPTEGAVPPKHHARRTSFRITQTELHRTIALTPGITLYGLVKDFFPDYEIPSKLFPRFHMALHRLSQTGRIERRDAKDENGRKITRWYTVEKLEGYTLARTKVICRLLAKLYGGHVADYSLDAIEFEKLMDYNAKFKATPETWAHPDDTPF